MATYDWFQALNEPWWTNSSMTMQPPNYPIMDYIESMGPTGSVAILMPGENVSTDFLANELAGVSSFKNKQTLEITIEPIPVEICYLSPPPDKINLEPTRFRKTYSYFRQRPRKF